MPDEKTDTKDFLREYGELCVKYCIIIDACGCCNSPYIYCLKGRADADHLIRDSLERLSEGA